MPNDGARVESLTVLSRLRTDFYACLTARVNALLCTEAPVRTLVGLSLAPEHRRGHGAMYDALNKGWIEVSRLRTVLTQLPLPRYHGRLVLAVDVSAWLRPDAATSPDRPRTTPRLQNHHRAPHPDIGKTTKRDLTIAERKERNGQTTS